MGVKASAHLNIDVNVTAPIASELNVMVVIIV